MKRILSKKKFRFSKICETKKNCETHHNTSHTHTHFRPSNNNTSNSKNISIMSGRPGSASSSSSSSSGTTSLTRSLSLSLSLYLSRDDTHPEIFQLQTKTIIIIRLYLKDLKIKDLKWLLRPRPLVRHQVGRWFQNSDLFRSSRTTRTRNSIGRLKNLPSPWET